MIPSSFTTTSPEETRQVGEALAAELEPGDVVLLVGGLGAGKTTFVQGVAAALGVSDDVTSPTFTLCQVHEGRLTVMHADLWRLERLSEVLDLAFEEGLEEGGVLLIEWGEGAEELFGDEALVVTFETTGGGDGEQEESSEVRLLRLEARGTSWKRRIAS